MVLQLQPSEGNSSSPDMMEQAMRIELDCPRCHTPFTHEETPAGEIWDRMTEEGPWFALGDGETLEDVLFTALTSQGAIRCPRCGEAVPVSQHELCEVSQQIL